MVNAATERSTTVWPGLLEKQLMAAIRTEFRVDLYVPDSDHPVLGRGTCPAAECDRGGNRLGIGVSP